MRRFLAVSACLLGLGLADAALACTKPTGAAGIESALADWINAERAKKGLGKLSLNADLAAVADSHACTMARQSKLSHQSFGNRLRSAGFGEGVENVARSTEASADAAARIWKKSAPHWTNLMNRNVKTMGIGTAFAGGRTYYVFMAGSP